MRTNAHQQGHASRMNHNTIFPIIGKNMFNVSNDWKNPSKSFQWLEKMPQKFPMIGKIGKKVSNGWKNDLFGVPALAGLSRMALTYLVLIIIFCSSSISSDAGFIGWASGGVDAEGGVLLVTTNGTDWMRQGTGQIDRVNLGGVSSYEDHVWVVGAETGGYGSVYYSADAGLTWMRQGDTNTIPSVDLQKPFAVNEQVVWVVGYEGTVLRTIDGGTTWEDVSITGFTQLLQGVTAVDAQTAWVSGGANADQDFGGLFYTTNGGADWVQQTQGYVTNVPHILGLSAVDAQHVWAIGSSETMLYTTNAGAEWMLKYTATLKDGNEVYTRGAADVWGACDAVLIWSEDNGTTWTNHVTWDYTMDISVPDGTNIWAVRSNYDGGTIYYSPDGGLTWTTQVVEAGYIGLFKLSMQYRPDPEPQSVFYVDAGCTNPLAPFASWATAATNIQDALDEADHGCTVLVTNGIYDTGGNAFGSDITFNRALIRKAVHLLSVNGPDYTTIVGREEDIETEQNPYRGILITQEADGARVSGFTVTNGHVTTYPSMSPVDQVGGGVMMLAGTLSNCVVRNCEGSGCAFMPPTSEYYARITDCDFFDNTGVNGGGLYVAGDCIVERCRSIDNVAVLDEGGNNGRGGGLSMLRITDQSRETAAPVVRNCFISGNLAESEDLADGGGGIFWAGGDLVNCTIINNKSRGMGGGIFIDTQTEETNETPIANCIIYYNEALDGLNYFYSEEVGSLFDSCCSVPVMDGVSITDEPEQAGLYNPHILSASPCRNAGNDQFVNPGEVDIDHEARTQEGQVDIGCDEFVATNIQGTLTVAIESPYDIVLVDAGVRLSSLVEGKANSLQWRIFTNGGSYVISDALSVTPSWHTAGSYDAVLEAVNADGMQASTVTVHVLDSFTNYVSKSGAHIAPYTNWATAATNIQAAIDMCYAGGVTLVDTGIYTLVQQVQIEKPMHLVAPNGYTNTIIDGARNTRCIFINDAQVVVDGFTLTNGVALVGGGVMLFDGTLRNCRINNCRSDNAGGGVKAYGDALVEWCWIEGNISYGEGGGVYGNINSIIRNCVIHANEAQGMSELSGGGGGVCLVDTAELRDSFVSDNQAWMGGGVMLLNGGVMRNATLLANNAYGLGGGLFCANGHAYNSIIYYNEAPECNDLFAGQGGEHVQYCCLPVEAGEGCITNRPALLGIHNPHIVAASPCIEAGTTNDVISTQRDIDDEQRVYESTTDIGCDEYIPTNQTGLMTARIIGENGTMVNDDVELFANITGRAEGYTWTIAAPGMTSVIANTYRITPLWTNAGTYTVTLTASNQDMTSQTLMPIEVREGRFTNYVSKGGLHLAPFISLTTAATNVQSAIDACYADGVVLVDTGVYQEVAEILLERPVTLCGMVSRDQTILDGGNNQRVIKINHDRARLENLTVTHGLAEHGAGIYIMDGMVSNCVISSCGNSNVTAGGVYAVGDSVICDSDIVGNTAFFSGGILAGNYSRIDQCNIKDNVAVDKGGGVRLMHYAHMDSCDVRGNLLHLGRGGGVFMDKGGEVTDSLINSNAAHMGAGVCLSQGGVISNSVIELSWGIWFAGGFLMTMDGVIVDSIIRNNYSVGGTGGGGIMNGQVGTAKQLLRCLVYDNTSKDAAGIHMENGGLIQDCAIYHNIASNNSEHLAVAGGAWIFNEGTMDRCVIFENYSEDKVGGVGLESGGELRNCLVYGNEAETDIGGVMLTRNQNMEESKDGVLRNCTIVDNTAGDDVGGVGFINGGDVGNSIIYGNTASDFNEYGIDEENDEAQMNYSCATPLFTNGVDNIDDNPLFASPGTTNYRLLETSPCINVGLNDYWMNDTTDLGGAARIIGRNVDMGAYEYPLVPEAFSTVGAAGHIRLHWGDLTHPQSYGVFRADTATGIMTRVATVVAGTTSWQDTIACGQAMYYRIVADYVGVTSEMSAASGAVARGTYMDFDADGIADVAVYCETSGVWAIRRSSDGQPELITWGWQDAEPVPGMYNQFCQTELAVYWPDFGRWFGRYLDTSMWTLDWGWSEADPVRGDFDGDGLQDVTVYYPEDGTWYIRRSTDTNEWYIQWGWVAAASVPGDFDGDGITDPAVYAAEEGRWYIRLSTTGLWMLDWGWSMAVPVVGDYDGDGKDDVAAYDPQSGYWFIRQSGSGGALRHVQWGWAGAAPVPADYDGDGKTDIAVHWADGRRWFILYSSTGLPGIFDWNYEGHAVRY